MQHSGNCLELKYNARLARQSGEFANHPPISLVVATGFECAFLHFIGVLQERLGIPSRSMCLYSDSTFGSTIITWSAIMITSPWGRPTTS